MKALVLLILNKYTYLIYHFICHWYLITAAIPFPLRCFTSIVTLCQAAPWEVALFILFKLGHPTWGCCLKNMPPYPTWASTAMLDHRGTRLFSPHLGTGDILKLALAFVLNTLKLVNKAKYKAWVHLLSTESDGKVDG